MNKELERLNGQIAEGEAKLRRAQQEEKILQNQIKTLTRKERTHRLCTRGAMLESFLPHPEAVTDEQVAAILSTLFQCSDTKRLIETILAGTRHKEDGE